MGRAVLNPYRGFTKETIKSRASIPLQADMALVGDTVECSVDLYQIHDALGISDLDFHGQHNSAAVNKWSGFGPAKRTEVAGVLVNSIEDPDGLFEFAGYNHAAPVPAFANNNHLDDIILYNGGSGIADFTADVTIGEAKFVGGDISNHGDCVGIALTVWDGVNLVGFGITDLAGLQNSANLEAQVSGISLTKEYTCKIFLTNSLVSFNQNLDNAVCQLSELANWNTKVWVLDATALNMNEGDWTVSSPGFNLPAGSVGFSDAYVARDIPGMVIQAKLMRYDDVQIGTTQTLYSDDYISGTHLGALSASFGMSNVPDYGYTFYIMFNEPA